MSVSKNVSRPLCGSEHPTGIRFPTGGVLTRSQSYGGHGERETPGHIPNPEAKPPSADGTAPATGWESRKPPDHHPKRGPSPPAAGPVRMPPPSTGTTHHGPPAQTTAVYRDK